jgi:catechol 2,3-dioxygenase-like lactoylglutathione lyase family enzyme
MAPAGIVQWARAQRTLQPSEAWLTFKDWIERENPRFAYSVARNIFAGSQIPETLSWVERCYSSRKLGVDAHMAVKLNHTIVAARDRNSSALFLSEILGLSPPVLLGPFALVTVGDELTLDFIDSGDDIRPQHYAFLVSETEFDQIFTRIEERRLPYWADSYQMKRDQINHWDDGRGVYFEDPNGHLLEILTRPYGSAGTAAQNPHPLVAEKLQPSDQNAGMPSEGSPAGSGGLPYTEPNSGH